MILDDISSYKIIVTDSGLGGLSVLAGLEKLLRESGSKADVHLIFFNALYDKEYGYNRMSSDEEKITIFNKALNSMLTNYKPDMILIACNTLSVLYNQTPFSERTSIPVIGIVKFGVDVIYEKLNAEPNSSVIIFGTPTTIRTGTHKNELINRGIDESRIINRECYLLESEIQNDAQSTKVLDMITKFTNEAASQITHNKKVYAALCCTHYGYSYAMFNKVMNSFFGDNQETLNPNLKMSEYVFKLIRNKEGSGNVNVSAVTKAEIYEEEIKSIGKLLKTTSPKTFDALQNYILDKNLF